MEMTDEEFERRQQWSMTAGQCSTAKAIHSLILGEAGRQFSSGNDAAAREFRNMALLIEATHVKPASEKLQGFIEENPNA
jgi:hypothetical protein